LLENFILNGDLESVADFIQGKASVTVGSMHYLAEVKQAMNGIQELLEV